MNRRTRLGDVLVVYRLISRGSVDEVAREIGVSPSTVRRIEAGNGLPDGQTCAKLFGWLLGWTPASVTAGREPSE